MANGINGSYVSTILYEGYPVTLNLTGDDSTGRLTGSVEYNTTTTASQKISIPINYGVYRFLNAKWPGPTAGTITVMQNDKFILNYIILTIDNFETLRVYDQGIYFPFGNFSLASNPSKGRDGDFKALSLNPPMIYGAYLTGDYVKDSMETDGWGILFTWRP